MGRERGVAGRRAATLIAVMTAARAVRSGAVWGAVFGLLVFNEAVSYHTNFPTVASREKFAQAFGGNAGFAAVIGSARRLDTIGGFVAWRVFGLLIIVGAIWGLLTATRLLRGEEDAGRWELLLSGRTTRRRATLQAIAGLSAGFVVVWTLTAAFTLAAGSRSSVGFSTSASLFYATAATASAAMFLAVGALDQPAQPDAPSGQRPRGRRPGGVAADPHGRRFRQRPGLAALGEPARLDREPPPAHRVPAARPRAGLPARRGRGRGRGGRRRSAGRRCGRVRPARDGAREDQLLGGPGMLVLRLERWVALPGSRRSRCSP